MSYVCLTCDVEGNPENWLDDISQFLKITQKYDAVITFFISFEAENYSFEKYKEISLYLHELQNEGHEIGLHIHWGFNHEKYFEDKSYSTVKSYHISLENFSDDELKEELKTSIHLMHDLDLYPVSFRGGGLCQKTNCLRILWKNGFKIDSSVAYGLNEKQGWYQGHIKIPLVGHYFPSKNRYDEYAFESDEKLGILELPVSKKGMDFGFNSILNPNKRSWKKISNWVISNQLSRPKIITALWHNWNVTRAREDTIRLKKKFPREVISFFTNIYNGNFLTNLDNMLRYYNEKDFLFVTLKQLQEILKKM